MRFDRSAILNSSASSPQPERRIFDSVAVLRVCSLGMAVLAASAVSLFTAAASRVFVHEHWTPAAVRRSGAAGTNADIGATARSRARWPYEAILLFWRQVDLVPAWHRSHGDPFS